MEKGKSTVLEIKNLSLTFQTEQEEVHAVEGIDLKIPRGATVGLVGESGSGKSVTALSVMRLLSTPPAHYPSGELWFTDSTGQSIDLFSLSQKEMRHFRGKRVGMIFQEPMTSLNPVFRCGAQILEAILLHEQASKAKARQQVIRLLEQVQLPDPERIYKAYPHELSGGQKQRVMIAMAISCNPELLIADEPTTALDVTVQKEILLLLKSLQRERQMSILFISHDLGVIAELADEVAVMYRGRIVEQNSVSQVFHRPQHPYTKGLLACRPSLDRKLRRLPVIEDFLEGKDKQVAERLQELEQNMDELKARREQLYLREPLLKVEQLHTWFPVKKNFFGKTVQHLRAVDGVSFEVYPGEMLGLVGESGCGKTTLGRSILRLVEPRGGKVLFRGQNLLSLSESKLRPLRRHLQIVFQDPFASLNPRMAVGQAILEPMQVHRYLDDDAQRRRRADELLEAVGLQPEHFSRYPHEFSGGQRQRICIARALALEPEFIVCDESVSALDVSVQAQVLNLLLDLRDRFNFTCVFISHDLSVVRFLSDRILVMKDGRILESGPPEQIYENPQHAYTQSLIEAIPAG